MEALKEHNYQLTYRKTSRLSLRIGKYGEVRVSAPYGYPQEEIDKFVEKNQKWIAEAQERTWERQRKRIEFFSQLPLNTWQECQEATNRMKATIIPLVEKHSRIMGVRPASISYKATISRWGCCFSSSRRLQFSAYLLLLPDWCIEHVVVHELAHLIEPNHSARFYALMDKFFPRWQEARKETKRISRMEIEE